MENIFYVYGLYEVSTQQIIYIGKGKGDRSKVHKPLLLESKHKNPKLQNKFNSIVRQGGDVEDKILEDNLQESEALKRETELISFYGLENLCNLTEGGAGGDCLTHNPNREIIIKKSSTSRIGLKRSQETKTKILNKLKEWKKTKEYQKYLKEMSENRIGKNNPMYGKKETEEHKKERMKNCLSKPRWNKGLTIKDDPRLEKLATWKGKLPPNAKKIKVIDITTSEVLEFNSIKAFIDHVRNILKKCNSKKVFKLLQKEIDIYERWKLTE